MSRRRSAEFLCAVATALLAALLVLCMLAPLSVNDVPLSWTARVPLGALAGLLISAAAFVFRDAR